MASAEISQGQVCAFCYTGLSWRVLKPSMGEKIILVNLGKINPPELLNTEALVLARKSGSYEHPEAVKYPHGSSAPGLLPVLSPGTYVGTDL